MSIAFNEQRNIERQTIRNDTLAWEILQFVNENEENLILFFNFIIPIIIHKILALHSNSVRVFVRFACFLCLFMFFLSLKAQSFLRKR